jgi:hypothetical protein
VQFPDGQGLVQIIAGTDLFTGMMAYPAANAGEGVVLFEQFQGFLVFALIDQGDITLNTDMGRAGGLAGGCAALADTESAGYRLGILLEYRLAIGQAFVVFVGQGDGADLGTFSTACAFCQIYKAGLLQDACAEISGSAFKIQEFRVG